jgi:hypothetical protein
MNHPNTRPRRIIAAVFWLGVKGGAYQLACPATIALIDIDFYCFNYFLFFLILHGSLPPPYFFSFSAVTGQPLRH